jgi:hypothetical protein
LCSAAEAGWAAQVLTFIATAVAIASMNFMLFALPPVQAETGRKTSHGVIIFSLRGKPQWRKRRKLLIY